ncbi:MAG: PqqD family protein [Clostridia bacterium]|nr:PqqD family protein [Clostridia bacterium]
MKINPHFVLSKIGDTHCVVPTGSKIVDFNGIIKLNETGKFIWEALASSVDIDVLISNFAEKFGIDMHTAQSDVTDFISLLKKNNILE